MEIRGPDFPPYKPIAALPHAGAFFQRQGRSGGEGVRIVVSPRELESIGYSPARDGDPSTATLHATEGMSLSAWEHEYAHFCFDRDHGYPGLGTYFRDPSLREESERTAYGVEIEMAREKGNNELVDRLVALMREEVDRIGNSRA